MESQFNIESSEPAIKNAIKKLDITWKNILEIPAIWNDPGIITKRMRFVASLGAIFLRPIVYVDEKGWNMHTKKSKGHAVRGEPAKLTLQITCVPI